MFWNKKNKLYVLEVETGRLHTVERFPYYIGFSSDCDLIVNDAGANPMASVMFSSSDSVELSLKLPNVVCKIKLNGNELPNSRSIAVEPNMLYSMLLRSKMFYFIWTSNKNSDIGKIDVNSWSVYDTVGDKYLLTNVPYNYIKPELESRVDSLNNIAVIPAGTGSGFWASDIIEDFSPSIKVTATTQQFKSKFNDVVPQKIDEDFGELLCPSCWLRFNRDELNYISVHASLMGDPLLGEDEKLRFLPTEYNARGMPLDPMGVPAREMACPHCHRKLPSTFMQMKNHIVSLVGAPSSGKSYYLTILLHFMPDILFKNAKVALVDADPPLNAVMTSLRNSLFSVDGVNDHYLAKTQLEGGMYDKLVRHGRLVSLPKPFTYILRDINDFSNQSSVTFYDNAGEHFEPSISIDDSPGSLHVASADVLMFLFDPLTSNEFKLKLDKSIDPQLDKNIIDQQDIILAEMANRIKQIKNITNSYDLGTPFAFIINKCDAIKDLFDFSQLEDPLENGKWNNDIVDRNSEKIRSFLLGISPNVVINAEMISRNIRYFMVSSFGHSPHKIKQADGSEFIAPQISMIHPYQIHAPFVWAFTNLDDCPLSNFAGNKNKSNSSFIF